MFDAVIVLSGGMDSTVLLAHELSLGTRPAALSFDYGSKHNDRELPLAAETCARYGVGHRIVRLPFMNELFSSSLLKSGETIPDGAYDADNMKSTVVPFRNGILIAIAVGYAESIGASRVLIGSHSGDHHIYPDCRPDFNAAMNDAALRGTDGKVQVAFPFADRDKRAIGDLGRSLDVDFARTWTCYKGGETHCGTCGACDERKYALRRDAGLDPTRYLK
jgi:7-cyano-7-deazaguanine synthase